MDYKAVFISLIMLFFLLLLSIPEYNFHSLNQGLYVSNLTSKEYSAKMLEEKTIFFKEGLHASVSVTEDDCGEEECDVLVKKQGNSVFRFPFGVTFSGNIVSLKVNGATQCSTTKTDLTTLTFLGGLPVILHENPKAVLNIGLGCGITLGVLEHFPFEKIDSVEIEPVVAEAAGYFNEVHGNALNDKRSRIYFVDARNYLTTSKEKYDVIINEPPIPLSSSVSNLYSREFMELMRGHLKEKGLVVQYLTVERFNSPDGKATPFKSYYKTFNSVFPFVQAFLPFVLMPSEFYVNDKGEVIVTKNQVVVSELILVGSAEPFVLSNEEMNKRLQERMNGPFQKIRVNDLTNFVLLNEQDLRGFADESVPLNTDDNPVAEFAVSRNSLFPVKSSVLQSIIEFKKSKEQT